MKELRDSSRLLRCVIAVHGLQLQQLSYLATKCLGRTVSASLRNHVSVAQNYHFHNTRVNIVFTPDSLQTQCPLQTSARQEISSASQ